MSTSPARQRIRACFVPQWEGSVEGWTVNHIKKNLWRLKPTYEMHELLQEGWLQFLITQERYPEVKDPPHFMALYKRLFSNRIHDLASERTRFRSYTYSETGWDEGNSDYPATSSEDLMARACKLSPEMLETELRMLVEDAPSLVQAIIASVQTAPEEILGFLRAEARTGARGLRETTRDRLARLAGCLGFLRDPDGWRESGDDRNRRLDACRDATRDWAYGS